MAARGDRQRRRWNSPRDPLGGAIEIRRQLRGGRIARARPGRPEHSRGAARPGARRPREPGRLFLQSGRRGQVVLGIAGREPRSGRTALLLAARLDRSAPRQHHCYHHQRAWRHDRAAVQRAERALLLHGGKARLLQAEGLGEGAVCLPRIQGKRQRQSLPSDLLFRRKSERRGAIRHHGQLKWLADTGVPHRPSGAG